MTRAGTGSGTTGRASTPALGLAGALVLFALHAMPWNPFRALSDGPVVLEWLPVELAWRLVWMALAWLYLLWFARRIWRDER